MNGYTIKLFIFALFIFVITDIVWLGFIAKNYYFEQYAAWLRLEGGQLKPLWWATLMVYLLLALSVVVFIIPVAQNSLLLAAVYGAVLGAIIYGVYDFTCMGIYKDFPIAIGLIDWIWGITLCSWSSLTTCYLANYLK
jgi:uncharacterized membrane protein